MLVEKAFLKKKNHKHISLLLTVAICWWMNRKWKACFLDETNDFVPWWSSDWRTSRMSSWASSRKPLKKRQCCILGRRGGATYLSWYFLLLEPLLFGVYNPLLQLFTSSLLWRGSHENYTLGFPIFRGSLPGSPCVSSWQIKADRLCFKEGSSGLESLQLLPVVWCKRLPSQSG